MIAGLTILRISGSNWACRPRTWLRPLATTYAYLADGRRVKQATPAETKLYLWDGRNVLAQADEALALQSYYTHRPGDWRVVLVRRGLGEGMTQDGDRDAGLRAWGQRGRPEKENIGALVASLALACETEALEHTERAVLQVYGCSARVTVYGGRLARPYCDRVDWASVANLVDPFVWLSVVAPDVGVKARHRIGPVAFYHLTQALSTAERYALGVRALGRFWWQTYTRCAPDTPVVCPTRALGEVGSPVSLCIACECQGEAPPLSDLQSQEEAVRELVAWRVPSCPVEIRAEPPDDVGLLPPGLMLPAVDLYIKAPGHRLMSSVLGCRVVEELGRDVLVVQLSRPLPSPGAAGIVDRLLIHAMNRSPDRTLLTRIGAGQEYVDVCVIHEDEEVSEASAAQTGRFVGVAMAACRADEMPDTWA